VKQADASGFTTAAAVNKVYKIEVDAQALAKSGCSYVRLKAVEVIDDPVAGGIIALLTGGRYVQEVSDSVNVRIEHGKKEYYGKFVELGTKKQPAKPFLRPAVDENKKQISEAVTEEIGRAVGKVR